VAVKDRIPARVLRHGDALIGLAVIAESLVEIASLDVSAADRARVTAAVLAIGLGLSQRRRVPLPAFVLSMAGFLTASTMAEPVSDQMVVGFFGSIFAVYSAGANLDGRRFVAAALIGATAMVLSINLDHYDNGTADYFWGAAVFLAAPLAAGRLLRDRSRLNLTLRDKALRLEREREELAAEAVTDERTRIAGELHDVIAHALSAMVIQGGAARRLAERDPDRARAAFGSVEETTPSGWTFPPSCSSAPRSRSGAASRSRRWPPR